ncbi:DUF3558 domain-containing protein [Nocardia iowensis]|uniref:DUF3558 domain-containing protein n=1 Tax=Nocardia iowensis TaxID=204891 RepID=A0ABX8RUT7_NOCIO|nr:DUF3558 domain-containing protein [Nocardia iowensis]QXN93404.1 DUF3558 domain-containing protein [Nocardia iowensis]
MTSRSNSWQLAALALGAVFVIAGCGSSTDGDPKPTGNSPTSTTSVAPDVPSGYDPCTDVPQSVLDSEKLLDKTPDDSNASGGIKWRGCLWVQTDGYGARIQTTNITVDMVRAKNFSDTREFTVNGRRAISTRQSNDHPEAACTVDVEMKGGSLEINLSNPPSRRNTGHLDTCDLTRKLAEKVVPTMPANV